MEVTMQPGTLQWLLHQLFKLQSVFIMHWTVTVNNTVVNGTITVYNYMVCLVQNSWK